MMKRNLFFIFFAFLASLSYGQTSNFVFFTEQGERFLLVLNGIQQNSSPETNVRITDLSATSFKVKVLFEDARIPELDKTLMIEPGFEFTCNIRKNSRNEYVIRLLSKVPLEQAPPPAPTQKVIIYHTTPVATTTTQTITTGTAVTTTTASPGSVTVTSGGVTTGASIGMTTATVTTSTTTQTVSTQAGHPEAEHGEYVLPGYHGRYGCPYPMDDEDFARAKASIASQGFDETKLTVAKQVAGSNCLLCSQVKEVMKLFSFEDTRLQFAKFAYNRTLDPGNYFMLNDAFDFSSSVDALNDYIQSLR